jgi:hypothetical protein
MAAATVSSPKTSPQLSERLVRGDDEAGPFVAAGDELEEHVGSFGLERIAMSVARRVLPVPGGPRNTTLPRSAMKSRGAQVGHGVALEAVGADLIAAQRPMPGVGLGVGCLLRPPAPASNVRQAAVSACCPGSSTGWPETGAGCRKASCIRDARWRHTADCAQSGQGRVALSVGAHLREHHPMNASPVFCTSRPS